MHIFFIQVFFVCFLHGFSDGARTYEESAEYVNLSSENETIPEDQPGAIVVELNKPLLENLKQMWEEELNFLNKETLLATFDSRGLVDVSLYNDTAKLRQALMEIQPPAQERPGVTPTLHALVEFVQNNLSGGSLLLVTMTKPSDEDFRETLTESLLKKDLRLSVFWLGQQTDDYNVLREIATKTGGKFKYSPIQFSTEEESTESNYFQRSNYKNVENFENFSDRFRFPEEPTENGGKEMPLATRAADQRAWQKITVPLIVEVASGTSLELKPGALTQIPFTIKNNVNVPLPVFFNARFNGIVQNVQPQQAQLQPAATIQVIVNLQPLGATPTSALGTLTLAAVVANRPISRSALISMTPQTVTDNTGPRMYHKYEGDCSNYKDPQVCENGHWSLEVTIQDEQSGLLKILSEPYGLLFQSQFIAGTKSPVTVYYGATCCQPNVIVWAEDLKGNYVKKTFDVFNQNLLAGEIASIVLGVLLLIFVIIAIIVAVILIRRRNSRKMIIPRARSGSR